MVVRRNHIYIIGIGSDFVVNISRTRDTLIDKYTISLNIYIGIGTRIIQLYRSLRKIDCLCGICAKGRRCICVDSILILSSDNGAICQRITIRYQDVLINGIYRNIRILVHISIGIVQYVLQKYMVAIQRYIGIYTRKHQLYGILVLVIYIIRIEYGYIYQCVRCSIRVGTYYVRIHIIDLNNLVWYSDKGIFGIFGQSIYLICCG